MADKHATLYSGLDKALLRSTQPTQPASTSAPGSGAAAPTSEAQPEEASVEEDSSAQRRMHARTHTRTQAAAHSGTQTAASARTSLVDTLFRALGEKQHLASSTFRFQPEELEELDVVSAEVARLSRRKVSKNDLVRLGLAWLLHDYKGGKRSVLAQVLERL